MEKLEPLSSIFNWIFDCSGPKFTVLFIILLGTAFIISFNQWLMLEVKEMKTFCQDENFSNGYQIIDRSRHTITKYLKDEKMAEIFSSFWTNAVLIYIGVQIVGLFFNKTGSNFFTHKFFQYDRIAQQLFCAYHVSLHLKCTRPTARCSHLFIVVRAITAGFSCS